VVTGTPVSFGNSNAGTDHAASATCATGKAISGGGTISDSNQLSFLTESKPVGTTNPNGWTVTATVQTKANATQTITAYVICG
jgi:hypothetical protein